jgi:pyruvate/2-oxoglutarate dehydrogenase complex dihydrolipoamide acyltransferase (E2) component
MDEVSFGPGRQTRMPSRRLRALAAAVSVAGIAAGGTAYAVTAQSARHATASQPPAAQSAAAQAAAGLPDPARLLPPPAGCHPTQADWPNLAGLPAGMRPGAVPVIVDAQFSGRCPVP